MCGTFLPASAGVCVSQTHTARRDSTIILPVYGQRRVTPERHLVQQILCGLVGLSSCCLHLLETYLHRTPVKIFTNTCQ